MNKNQTPNDQPQVNFYTIIGQQQVKIELLSAQLKAALKKLEEMNAN